MRSTNKGPSFYTNMLHSLFFLLLLEFLVEASTRTSNITKRDCQQCSDWLSAIDTCQAVGVNVTVSQISCFCQQPNSGQNALDCMKCGGPPGWRSDRVAKIALYYYTCKAYTQNGSASALDCLYGRDDSCDGFLSGVPGANSLQPSTTVAMISTMLAKTNSIAVDVSASSQMFTGSKNPTSSFSTGSSSSKSSDTGAAASSTNASLSKNDSIYNSHNLCLLTISFFCLWLALVPVFL